MPERPWTKPPWHVKQSLGRHDGEYDYAISGEGAPVLGEAFGRASNGTVLPAEANGNLLAAAPALYEALANMLPRFERCCRHAGNSDDVIADATAQARAALSQARGE